MTEVVKPTPEQEATMRSADMLRVFRGSAGHEALLDLIREKRATAYEVMLIAKSTEELFSAQGYSRALMDMELALDERIASADQIADRLAAATHRRHQEAVTRSRPAEGGWRSWHGERAAAV